MTVIWMTPDPLTRRLAQLSWPEPATDRPNPKPGQLWRAAWGKTAVVVVVVGAAEGRRVEVVATSGEPVGDDSTIAVDTEVGLRPTVWSRLRSQIGVFTLDQRLGDLTAESWAALRDGETLEALGQWAPIVSDLDDRALVVADLEDRLRSLVEAEWLPMATPGEPLRVLLERSGLTVSALAQILDITPGSARRLAQALREATEEERARMAVLFGVPADDGVTFDEELVAVLDQPTARPSVWRWAEARDLDDEGAARRDLATAVLALAARPRDPRGGKNWAALIEEIVNAG